MESRLKFFNETFKVLLAIMVCGWLMYLALIFLVSDNNRCMADTPDLLFTISAWTVGILSAPPLVYGMARLFFAPNSGKSQLSQAAGWIVSIGAGIFVAGLILFALAISQYGCQ
ncbi:MAG TPA: hypothetical protein VL737_00545 [Candidatus Pristimantibacillus sp.]|nr:hypothetical protein [Candidatus Pristimantibacillus sp.]